MKSKLLVVGNVLTTVFTVLLALLVVFHLAIFVKGKVTGERCPTVLGFGTAVVISGSMEPDILVNDVILIHAQDSYAVGDVITFRTDGNCVTHRVIAISLDESGNVIYTTQGDSNNTVDDPVPADRIVGKVILVIPAMGYLQEFLQTPLGFLVLTLLAGAMIFVPEYLKSLKKKNKTPEGEDNTPPIP